MLSTKLYSFTYNFCRIFDVKTKKEGYRYGTPFSINLIQQGVSIRRLQTTFHNVRCYGL